MSNGSSNWPNSRLLIRLDSWQWAVLDEMAYSEDYVDEGVEGSVHPHRLHPILGKVGQAQPLNLI